MALELDFGVSRWVASPALGVPCMLEFVFGVCWCSCWLVLVVLGVCWCTLGVSVVETLPGVRQLGSLASCAKEELKSNFQKKFFTLLGVLYSPVGPIDTNYISAKETI